MRLFLFLVLLTSFTSCNSKDEKFVRKQLKTDDIDVKWFYYSYISNVSPDFIVISKHGTEKQILKANRLVLDVKIASDSIIIKTVKAQRNSLDGNKIIKEIFGYKIHIDYSGTYRDLQNIPDGVKEREL